MGVTKWYGEVRFADDIVVCSGSWWSEDLKVEVRRRLEGE